MEVFMGSTSDKLKGHANEALGKAREKIGATIGSDEMQAKGVAQTLKGKTQVGIGKAKDAVKRATDNL
jgi:uncharacterized protein YjbJ (UPF0337 family)